MLPDFALDQLYHPAGILKTILFHDLQQSVFTELFMQFILCFINTIGINQQGLMPNIDNMLTNKFIVRPQPYHHIRLNRHIIRMLCIDYDWRIMSRITKIKTS